MQALESGISAQQLHEHLHAHRTAEVDQWAIHLDGEEIWLTNPYGIDVCFYPANTEGCARILKRIADNDHDREW